MWKPDGHDDATPTSVPVPMPAERIQSHRVLGYSVLVPIEILIESVLCFGNRSIVVHAVDGFRSQSFSVKANADPFSDFNSAQRALLEVKLLVESSHPNVWKIHRVLRHAPLEQFSTLSTICSPFSGTLMSVMKQAHLATEEKYYLSYQLLSGLQYIHDCGISHGRLRPDSVYITSALSLYVGDLNWPPHLTELDVTNATSLWYVAPEVLSDITFEEEERSTYKMDVWSAGCIMAELFLGRPLFPGRSLGDQLQKIREYSGSRVDSNPSKELGGLFERVDPDIVNLIELLLTYEPQHRITIHEALCHPCFANCRNLYRNHMQRGRPLLFGDCVPRSIDEIRAYIFSLSY